MYCNSSELWNTLYIILVDDRSIMKKDKMGEIWKYKIINTFQLKIFYSSCFSSSRRLFTCKRNMKNDTVWFIIWKHTIQRTEAYLNTLFYIGHKDDISFQKWAKIGTSVDVTQNVVLCKVNKFDLNFRNISIFCTTQILYLLFALSFIFWYFIT